MGCGVWSVGCGVWGVGCGVWGVGCGVWGVGCGVWGVGCGVWGVGCGVWGVGCGVWEGTIIVINTRRVVLIRYHCTSEHCIITVLLCLMRALYYNCIIIPHESTVL